MPGTSFKTSELNYISLATCISFMTIVQQPYQRARLMFCVNKANRSCSILICTFITYLLIFSRYECEKFKALLKERIVTMRGLHGLFNIVRHETNAEAEFPHQCFCFKLSTVLSLPLPPPSYGGPGIHITVSARMTNATSSLPTVQFWPTTHEWMTACLPTTFSPESLCLISLTSWIGAPNSCRIPRSCDVQNKRRGVDETKP